LFLEVAHCEGVAGAGGVEKSVVGEECDFGFGEEGDVVNV
jgi:hypothetical protein